MSELHTFFAESLPDTVGENPSVVLQGQECRHLVSVLRLREGETVRLLDGRGHAARAEIVQAGKREAHLKLVEVEFAERPASLAVIALAFSKAVRRGFFLEKAVELGAHEVWLWQGEHSQGKLPADTRDAWQAKMIAGCKQCGNPWLPAVRAFPKGLADVIKAAGGFEHHVLPWEMQTGVPILTEGQIGQPGRTIYVIGPEGGFSAHELELLRAASYEPVSFGQRILRCETAATLCLGLHWWASQQAGRPDAPRT